jgi:mannose-6-phosphate isomerase-like protein (cupin superfamily)
MDRLRPNMQNLRSSIWASGEIMGLSVTEGCFVTEAEAIAALKRLDYYPATFDVPATENDFHWHAFDSVFYILEGGLDITVRDTGETLSLKAGDRVEITGPVVHRERHDGYKAVFGISVDPSTLTMPLEKEPPPLS